MWLYVCGPINVWVRKAKAIVNTINENELNFSTGFNPISLFVVFSFPIKRSVRSFSCILQYQLNTTPAIVVAAIFHVAAAVVIKWHDINDFWLLLRLFFLSVLFNNLVQQNIEALRKIDWKKREEERRRENMRNHCENVDHNDVDWIMQTWFSRKQREEENLYTIKQQQQQRMKRCNFPKLLCSFWFRQM